MALTRDGQSDAGLSRRGRRPDAGRGAGRSGSSERRRPRRWHRSPAISPSCGTTGVARCRERCAMAPRRAPSRPTRATTSTLPDLDVNRLACAHHHHGARWSRPLAVPSASSPRDVRYADRVRGVRDTNRRDRGAIARRERRRLAAGGPRRSAARSALARGARRVVDADGAGARRLRATIASTSTASVGTAAISARGLGLGRARRRHRRRCRRIARCGSRAREHRSGGGRSPGRHRRAASAAGSTPTPRCPARSTRRAIDATVAVRDGAFGEFKYRALDATFKHDASGGARRRAARSGRRRG